MKKLLVTLGAALAIFAAPTFAATTVSVANAWTRATPGTATICAVYLDMVSSVADRLIGASAPIAARGSIHLHKISGGIATMRPVDGVDLAPGTLVSFVPMGYHIMLTGLKNPLRVGQHFPLTLRFAKSGEVVADVEVKPLRDKPVAPVGRSMETMPGMGDMGMMK